MVGQPDCATATFGTRRLTVRELLRCRRDPEDRIDSYVLCPCGSGKKYRFCHRRQVHDLRRRCGGSELEQDFARWIEQQRSVDAELTCYRSEVGRNGRTINPQHTSDPKHNMTYHVMAYRTLRRKEVLDSIAQFLSQPITRRRGKARGRCRGTNRGTWLKTESYRVSSRVAFLS